MRNATSGNEKKNIGGAANGMPLPDPNQTFAGQRTAVLLAMCLFGEARGESDAARRAVAQVILNRARHPQRVFGSRPKLSFEENLRRVILQPRQFSCFLPEDANCIKLLRPLEYDSAATWQKCLDAAQQALARPELLITHADARLERIT